jgi:hypothetical protein
MSVLAVLRRFVEADQFPQIALHSFGRWEIFMAAFGGKTGRAGFVDCGGWMDRGWIVDGSWIVGWMVVVVPVPVPVPGRKE